jgi:nucleoporin POM152
MNGTPRLRSAFPQTPQANRKTQGHGETPIRVTPHTTVEPRPSVAKSQTAPSPFVPVEFIDAPTQRFYILAIYIGLNSWRFFEAWTDFDELDSTWLFLKWVFIDGIFLLALQTARIPWLEWTFPTTLAIFLLHVVVNIFLVFHIPVCSSAPRHLPLLSVNICLVSIVTSRRLVCGPGESSIRDRALSLRTQSETG